MQVKDSTRFRFASLFVLSGLILFLGSCGQGRAPAPHDSPAQGDAPVRIVRTHRGYCAVEGADTALVYHRRPIAPDRAHARSHYIHPLYGLEGEVLTEDSPADHPHQHGIFWAWHQVFAEGKRMGDGWTQEDLSWEVFRVETSEHGAGSASIKAFVRWRSPRLEEGFEEDRRSAPFLQETATMRIHPAQERYRLIDFEISLRALTEDVRLGGSDDQKGYGGFSLRLRLPGDIRFTGPGGAVRPRVEAVAPRKWVDFSGAFVAEEQSGVAVLQHPSTPNAPHPWILRERASMQNVKWPGRRPVSLPPGQPLTLRYRLVVHRGDASGVPLNRLQAAYAQSR